MDGYSYIENSSPKQIIVFGLIYAAISVAAVLLINKFEKAEDVKSRRTKIIGALCFSLLFYFALAIRVFYASGELYHPDISSFFLPWTRTLMEKPLTDFYFVGDVSVIDTFHDYTPLFMYCLWFFGYLAKTLAFPDIALIMMIKIPAVICDMVAAWFVYLSARKITGKKFISYALSLTYAFCPAILLDSAIWGQVDGITAMFFVIVFYFMLTKRDSLAIFFSVVGMCFKLQFVFCAPAIGIYYLVKWCNKDKKCFIDCVYGLLYGVAFFVAVNAPFTYKIVLGGNVLFPLKLYVNQISNYAYYTLNSFNLYGALGLNFIALPETAVIAATNAAVIFGTCIIAVLYYFRHPEIRTVPLICAFVIMTTFTFSFKMHERYMFGAIAGLVLALCFKRDLFLSITTALCAFTVFLNIGWIMIIPHFSFDYDDPRMVFGSIIELCSYLSLAVYMLSGLFYKKPKQPALALAMAGGEVQGENGTAVNEPESESGVSASEAHDEISAQTTEDTAAVDIQSAEGEKQQ